MGFNLTKTDFMYVANTPKGSDFSRYSTPLPPPSLFIFYSFIFSYLTPSCAWVRRRSHLRSGEIRKYGPLELEPAATVFSYGQSLFEGLKGTPLHSTLAARALSTNYVPVVLGRWVAYLRFSAHDPSLSNTLALAAACARQRVCCLLCGHTPKLSERQTTAS